MAQINTKTVTVKSILNNHFFTRGMKDYLAGKPFDPEYDNWPYMPGRKYVAAQWCYERGRQFAAATKGTVPTKIGDAGKEVSQRAIWTFTELYNQQAIL